MDGWGLRPSSHLVGAPEKPLSVAAFPPLLLLKVAAASRVQPIKAESPETQEMLDFCGKHSLTSDVEVIPIQKVNEAYERLIRSDVKYRFSIHMASLKAE